MKPGLPGRQQDLQGPPRRLQLPAVLQGRGEGRAARRDLLLRPGRQPERDPLERLEAQLRRTATATSRPAMREVPAWALITNLRMDPYERGHEGRRRGHGFLAQQMWLLVPIQGKIKEFFARLRAVPVPGGQFAQRRRHQLRIAAAAGGDEAAQGSGECQDTLRAEIPHAGRAVMPASMHVICRREANRWLMRA